MIKKLWFKIGVSVLLVLSLTACKGKDVSNNTDNIVQTEQKVKLTLDEFTEKIFREDITRDLMTYVLMVENPASFELTGYPHTIDTYKKAFYEETITNSEERLQQLLTYEYSTLSNNQKMEYDLLKGILVNQIAMKDCYYYLEPLSTYTGDHVIGAMYVSNS